MSILKTINEFPNEQKCMEFLVAERWPSGIRCVTCGGDQISTITRATKGRNKRGTVYQCLEKTCKQQFTATVGTIFHKSHIPLQKWFIATAMIMDAKKGISALQIQRHLGIKTYKSAWHMCHRIRKSMVESTGMLTGTVEIDETYVGGRIRGKTSKEAKNKKEIVIGLRQRQGGLRLVHVKDTKVKTLQAVIEKHVSPDVETIMTDDFSTYLWALKDNFSGKHQVIQHKGNQFVNARSPYSSAASLGTSTLYHPNT